jgi:ribosome-binding protein aMBF1 (putative translation factor)
MTFWKKSDKIKLKMDGQAGGVMNEFGKYVREARKVAGLKTNELAQLSAVSASLICGSN